MGTIGCTEVNASFIATQQVVDQSGHVTDAHVMVAVHIAKEEVLLLGEIAGIAGSAVDVGIFLVRMVGVVSCSLATHQAGTVLEHVV